MRPLLLLFLLLASCASTDYQAYEGLDAVQQGRGGTKVTVDGVDIWTTGAPPRRFQVLGLLRASLGDGLLHDAIMHQAVAGEVRSAGGNAAVILGSSGTTTGVFFTNAIAAPISSTSNRYAVVRYLD